MNAATDLVRRLCNIADALADNRSVQIADATIRDLRHEIDRGRMTFSDGEFEVGYQATCLIECLAELAYSRTDRDALREERARTYVDMLRKFMRADIAERRAVTA